MKKQVVNKKKLLQLPILIIFSFYTSITYAGSLERLFAPKPDLWPVWQQHEKSSTLNINHQAWDDFLKNNLKTASDGINRINYAKVSHADIKTLQNYIAYLERIKIHQYNKLQQLAYWVNLYNSVTVNVILQHYPVTSIQDINISPGFFSIGPWGKKLVNINEHMVSLNDIEHRILRPIWKDPRIHYALNCASLGCPNLLPQAYTAENIESRLENAARQFVNHPRGVKIDNGKLYVSSIYSWFQEDFGEGETGVIQHLKKYAHDKLNAQLKNISEIAGDDYDWLLNDSQPYQPVDNTY